MPKQTRAAFFRKAINLVRRHGEVVIYFSSRHGFQRRRKFKSNGKCYVSHRGDVSGVWHHYATSCFVLDAKRKLTIEECFKLMRDYDQYDRIYPLMMQWGKGKNMKRLNYRGT